MNAPARNAESFVDDLVRRADSLRFRACEPSVQEATRLLVLDTLSCAAASTRVEAELSFARVFDGPAGTQGDPSDELATQWFTDTRVPPEHAARYNACLIHHSEMDDGHPRASLHGGSVIVPSALAVAESRGCDAETFWSALVGAYEAAVSLGAALKPGCERRGLHTPGVVGIFGASCAAGLLISAPPRSRILRNALSLSASQLPLALFEAFTKGSNAKTLYAGHAAYAGVQAARFAAAGLSGPAGIFDAGDGLSALFGSLAWGEPADADPPAVATAEFKAYASLRATHPSLGALETLLPLEPQSIESIHITTFSFATRLSENADPTTSIGAQCSLPYCVASLILDGRLDPDSFAPDRLQQRARLELARRVEIVADPSCSDTAGRREARLRVHLRQGIVRHASVTAAPWNRSHPATRAEIERKAERIAPRHATDLISILGAEMPLASPQRLLEAIAIRPLAR